MANPREIEETSTRPRPQWVALFEMGFRPLYLAGACWAALSIAIWVFAPQLASGTLAGPAWHAHEMLWGFVATIAVGFLMTAGATWTGINPLHGGMLALACALWAIARLGFLLGPSPWFEVAAASELAFFGLAATAMGRAVYRSRNRRNYGVPFLLLGLGVTDGLHLLAALALRLFALVPSSISFIAVQLSALAWVAAFALYLWRFFPMMVRPRLHP